MKRGEAVSCTRADLLICILKIFIYVYHDGINNEIYRYIRRNSIGGRLLSPLCACLVRRKVLKANSINIITEGMV